VQNFQAEIPRRAQLILGMLVSLIGVPTLAFAVWGVQLAIASSGNDRTAGIILAAIFVPLGGSLTLFGFRLLSGRGHGGKRALLSPWALRLAGVVILAVPVLFFAVGNRLDFILALTHIGFAGVCFALASARTRREPAESPQS
jgi:hypothetical protein